jgi:hypothetical protein
MLNGPGNSAPIKGTQFLLPGYRGDQTTVILMILRGTIHLQVKVCPHLEQFTELGIVLSKEIVQQWITEKRYLDL